MLFPVQSDTPHTALTCASTYVVSLSRAMFPCTAIDANGSAAVRIHSLSVTSPLLLTGEDLAVDDVWHVAVDRRHVALATSAVDRMRLSADFSTTSGASTPTG